MLTTICLIRHGETDWNKEGRLQGREDIELNEAGKLQAAKCAEYLSRSHWDEVVSSPLKRALQTAKIIKNRLNLYEIQEVYSFIERDYGEGSGLTKEERDARFPDGVVAGVEDNNTLAERTMNAMIDIVESYRGKRVIIISHGSAINSILASITKNQIGTGKTVLKNGCISFIQHDGYDWEILKYNPSAE